nr:MAG TPA: hypothetical protein [Caudoviricetes sp.]
MKMAKYKIKTGQNIFDVAIHLYGSIEGLFDLLISNTWLTMNTDLKPGMELEYHDYYVINDGIVNEINNNQIIPSNGSRHVYNKESQYSLRAICHISPDSTLSCLSISGDGTMQIDWGDNSGLEDVVLSNSKVSLSHYFDNTVEQRRIKIYGDFNLMTLDSSKLNGDIFPITPIVVDEYVSRSNRNSLKGLFLFDGTVIVDLEGSSISDLSPIYDMSLQELNLKNVGFANEDILDNYLLYIVSDYGTRRNCTVYLSEEPSEAGMNAILQIINEPDWNDAGAWKFIINDKIYTKE